jgi:signal transduction histidine kinase
MTSRTKDPVATTSASNHVEWFPVRLRHILDNLFSNALKYRDSSKVESWVECSLEVSPDTYELRVCDNGVGLPRDQREHLFELFYRAAPTRAAGLVVVKRLVEQSGGRLTVDSAEGQGTTFVVVLPRYDVDDFLM